MPSKKHSLLNEKPRVITKRTPSPTAEMFEAFNSLYTQALSSDDNMRKVMRFLIGTRKTISAAVTAQTKRLIDYESIIQEPMDTLIDRERHMLDKIDRFITRLAHHTNVGAWALSHDFIGPAYVGAMIGYVKIDKRGWPHGFANESALWRYAGYDSSPVREGNYSRTVHAAVLQAVKSCARKKESFYSELFWEIRHQEVRRNEAGGNKRIAESILKKNPYRYGSVPELKLGKLPPKLVARRTGKRMGRILLQHWFAASWWFDYGEQPPVPYIARVNKKARIVLPPGIVGLSSSRADSAQLIAKKAR